MNHPAFQAVCRQVSLGLEAADPDALAFASHSGSGNRGRRHALALALAPDSGP